MEEGRNGKKKKKMALGGSREEGPRIWPGVEWVGVATAERIEDLGNLDWKTIVLYDYVFPIYSLI